MAEQPKSVPSKSASVTPPEGKARSWLIFSAVGIFSAIVFGLLYLFVIAPAIPADADGWSMGWFLFSFATGLTMIVLPCTLPLAFVIVPLSMGKGMIKGLGMALSFGIGIATTLSLYGVAAALLGGVAIDQLGGDLDSIKNWVYFVAGSFALVFALSEIGLMNFHMPTYSGSAPAFIQKRGEFIKAFLLGLFLGNVGVGCPHPATPLILIEIASSGDVLYGWMLFLIHAIGRVLPLLLLAFLAILGVNGLNWLLARKDVVERTTGWAMVFVAGFILTLGLFTHDWWVNSGLHSGLETLTQESRFNALLNDTLDTDVAHAHGLEDGTGLFGMPLHWGNWFLVTVWLLPMYWWYRKRKKEVHDGSNDCDERMLNVKRNFLIVIAIFIVLVFTQLLPDNFYLKSVGGGGHDNGHGSEATGEHDMGVMGMMSNGTPFSTDIAGLPEATNSETVELADGDSYNITAAYVKKEVGNRTLRMLAYNGSVPGPFIKVPQGAEVTINFTNNTDIDQTIHSHGVRLDNNFDGVPGVTQGVVKPGDSFTYTIKFEDAGVYWYHPHTRDDYGQEMGLYGNYIIDPENGYSSTVNREVPVVIDDILIENEKISDFYKETTNFALLGRFGNEYLVNGEEGYSLEAKAGEVIRFFVTNVSNARTYNLSIPGAQMKLVGADIGQYEQEEFANDFLISPAERMIVEVYFESAGTYTLKHTTPDGQVALMEIVVSDDAVENSYADEFEILSLNQSVIDEFSDFRSYNDTKPDKSLLLTVQLMGMVDHSAHTGHAHDGSTTDTAMAGTHGMPDGSIILTDGSTIGDLAEPLGRMDKVQWNDPGQSDKVNTSHNVVWKLVDQETGRVSMDIPVSDWTFKEGDLVKVRLTNDADAEHVMQHPIHLHGQRFVVLSENGVPNDNLAWKDTVLVFPGEVVDILVEMNNLGEWMSHCHISEHLHAGMMMQFRVEDENGYATGDEYRATVPAEDSGDHMHGNAMMNSAAPDTEVRKSSFNLNFNTELLETDYSVYSETLTFKEGKKDFITISLFDGQKRGVVLSEDYPNPLGITFVKSDGTQHVYTYPGSLEFDNMEELHGSESHDNSDVHHDSAPAPAHDNSDGHHGLKLVPTAYAHGGKDDGHPDELGRVYEYTMPVYFTEKGSYRAFVEFVPEGKDKPVLLALDVNVMSSTFSVDNYGWSKELKWWILLIGTILLTIPLVFGVRRYINVEKI